MSIIDEIDEGLEIKRKFSLVWFIPLLALAVTMWLVYNSYVNAGTEVTIVFDSGALLTPGKTSVKYLGIEVGKISDVTLYEKDPKKVKATIVLNKEAAIVAKEGTVFWIVKPRIDFGNISGFETILSGSYIDVKPPSLNFNKLKSLPTKTFFVALERPPQDDFVNTGEYFSFYSEKKGALDAGSGIYYKGIKVGHIEDFKLDNGRVAFNAIAYSDYISLLKGRFSLWRVKPVDLQLSAKGVKLETGPVEVLVRGGVEIGLFGQKGKKSRYLHTSKDEARQNFIKNKKMKKVFFESNSMRGLKEGAPILYKRMKVGEIGESTLQKKSDKFRIEGFVYPQYRYLVGKKSIFWKLGATEINAKTSSVSISTPTIGEIMSGGVEFRNADYKLPKKGDHQIFESAINADHFINRNMPGLRLKLLADRRWSLDEGSPVYYRQVQVGRVEFAKLARSGKKVMIHIFIENKYKHLLYHNSVFWNAGGVGTQFSLVKGVKIKTESLKALFHGGVSFATPVENRGGKARNGDRYMLYERPQQSWVDWSPNLAK